jgi:hypothetical protein
MSYQHAVILLLVGAVAAAVWGYLTERRDRLAAEQNRDAYQVAWRELRDKEQARAAAEMATLPPRRRLSPPVRHMRSWRLTVPSGDPRLN